MQEKIIERRSFTDVDVGRVAYIEYEKYNWLPNSEDFEYGKEHTIVLRNKLSGKLEQMKYVLSGGVPSLSRPGYCWFWGDVISDDYSCCLVFNFDLNGECNKITVSFCGKSPSFEQFEEIVEDTKYPAEFTARFPLYY